MLASKRRLVLFNALETLFPNMTRFPLISQTFDICLFLMWLQIYCFLYINKIVFCINVKNLTRRFYYIRGPTLLKFKSMKKIHLISVLIAIACNSSETNSKDVIEIDFQYIKQKIIIPVEIDNEIYQFFLDTGNRTSISNDL